MEKIKIIQIVVEGDRKFYVLNRLPEFVYHKVSNMSIVGKDEGIYETFGYEKPSRNWKAFSGREFDLVLDDGSIEHCYGQWWDTINSDMKDYVPINNIISFAYSSINKLKDSYVFYGGKVDKLWLDNLISEYNATNKDHLEYEYWEYKNLLNNNLV